MGYGNFISNPKIYSLFYSVCALAALVMAVSGVMFSLISAGVLGIWAGMEINFMGVICFMSGVYVEESESVMKYLIIQVIGSCFLLLGILTMVYWRFPLVSESFVIFGLMMKLGIFPFHFWVPGVMSSLSWAACFMVSVVQKVSPLWFLSNFMGDVSFCSLMEVLAVLTSVVGCLGGLGMLNYRVMLGYSSLVHLGFLVILCLSKLNLFWGYLGLYSILNCGLMWSLWSLNIYSYYNFIEEGGMSYYNELWWTSLYFFSLAGIPPFSGIFLKVFFLVNCWVFFPLGCVVCIASSAVSMYFYMSVIMEMVMYWGKSTMLMSNKWKKEKVSILILVSIFVNLLFSYPLFLLCGM
uniref:NADH-ubiquinone oxidoreductase chain 2 n=1 Tax=Callista chinensis TaxID=990943 RepID=A0A889QID3_9BIVA|nr:NADH dehydrogenase subunit 2 [Callista chinensis]QRE83920.1 NADH dehydrogenase subunit 2 [Callista chinensis]QWM94239.1 NADH dehydrogenase subunit 2 [Callista chinensis]